MFQPVSREDASAVRGSKNLFEMERLTLIDDIQDPVRRMAALAVKDRGKVGGMIANAALRCDHHHRRHLLVVVLPRDP